MSRQEKTRMKQATVTTIRVWQEGGVIHISGCVRCKPLQRLKPIVPIPETGHVVCDCGRSYTERERKQFSPVS